jgi:predicted outer membrane repeat protein
LQWVEFLSGGILLVKSLFVNEYDQTFLKNQLTGDYFWWKMSYWFSFTQRRVIVKNSIRFTIIIAILVSFFGINSAKPARAAAEWIVTNTSDNGLGSLRQLIAEASDGDTITFDTSLAGETILLESNLIIDKDVAINGEGLSPQITVSGNNVAHLEIPAGRMVTLSNLIISEGIDSGIKSWGDLVIEDSTLRDNIGTNGGAIYIATGSVEITNSIFFSNTASSGGGAIYNYMGILEITNSTLHQNQAGGGGAIRNSPWGQSTIIESTLSQNQASIGGGIYGNNRLVVEKSTITQNQASSSGGGIYIPSDGAFPILISNSTISQNQTGTGSGGAIDITGTGTVHLTNSTITGNHSGNAAGSINMNGLAFLVVSNSTIAGNTASGTGEIQMTGAPQMALINSIVVCTQVNTTCYDYIPNNVGLENSIMGTGTLEEYGLAPLADNGGPTQTMALLPGSPAIDAGDDETCEEIDQRGVTRPQGNHCDIGAFELIQHTIYGNVGTAGVTLNYTDGTSKTAISDENGDYLFAVSTGWSGMVTPHKPGYIFDPANRTYSNLIEDQTEQNYLTSATETMFAITGNAGIDGATLSYFDGTAKTATADENGDYVITVPYNWSGTVTPTKPDHRFMPKSRGYFLIQEDQNAQDYSATLLFTITGNAGISNATLGYFDGEARTVTADENGNYEISVPDQWSGAVTPYKEGYTFSPPERAYSDIIEDQTDQDYTATQITYTISGNTGASDVTLTVINYSGGTNITTTVISDSEGNYSVTVPYNWSSEIRPSKAGFTFSPAFKQYFYVREDKSNQNFAVSVALITISGNTGTAKATLYYTDETPKSVTSDWNGNYSFTVPYNWSGTVTPFRSGSSFAPFSRSYLNLEATQTSQNYTAETTTATFIISGYAGVANATLLYTDGTNKTATTDDNGYYSIVVSYNWFGTVTPSKPGYIFTPASKTFYSVLADLSGEDYNSAAIYTISGNVGVAGAMLTYMEDGVTKSIIADANGNYSFTVFKDWSGMVTPTKPGVILYPASRTYVSVQSNQSDQNYLATLTVTNAENSGAGSLRQAVLDAASGAIIKFDPALSGKTILLDSEIAINKSLTIDGSGLDPYVEISGGGSVKIFVVGMGYGVNNLSIILDSVILKNGRGFGQSYFNNGAAIHLNSSNTMIVKKTLFLSNVANGDGAAIYSEGNLTIIESKFLSNVSQGNAGGGAIFVNTYGRLTIRDSIFSNNQALSSGGAIYFSRGWKIDIENATFEDNIAESGGALSIFNSSSTDASIRNSLFSRNTATSSKYTGGAILSSSVGAQGINTIIENVTFFKNHSAGFGGAISTDNGITLRNNTFSHNQADKSGASLYINGRYIGVNIYNSIFANNTGGGECSSNYDNKNIRGDNNIVQDGSSVCVPTIAFDPLLVTLADNGGPTQTMSLLPGSPAIDAGNEEFCLETDQRGVMRPQGVRCDIGAYEFIGTDSPKILSITRAFANPTAAASINFNVTFSEPVTNIDVDDFDLTTSGISGAVITAVNGLGAEYTVAVNTGSGSGTIRLDMPASASITDLGGNPLTGLPHTNGEAYNIKKQIALKSNAVQDGWILESTETSNKGGTKNNTASTLNLGDDSANRQYRAILSFNTGPVLPDNATITKVILKVKKGSIVGNGNPVKIFNGFMVDIQEGTYGSPSLQLGDFSGITSDMFGPFSPALSSGWYSINISKGKDLINKTGVTQFRLRFKLDDNNDFTTNSLKLYSGNASAANRPQLIMEYFVP